MAQLKNYEAVHLREVRVVEFERELYLIGSNQRVYCAHTGIRGRGNLVYFPMHVSQSLADAVIAEGTNVKLDR